MWIVRSSQNQTCRQRCLRSFQEVNMVILITSITKKKIDFKNMGILGSRGSFLFMFFPLQVEAFFVISLKQAGCG